MESIDCLLQLDAQNEWKRTEKSIAFKFEQNNGLDALEELQKNPNKSIYDQSVKILSDHFELDND